MLTRKPFGFPNETSRRLLDVKYGIIAFCYPAATGPGARGKMCQEPFSDWELYKKLKILRATSQAVPPASLRW